MEKNDHFDGRRFTNPSGANGQPFSALPRLFREPRTPWPAQVPTEIRQPPSLGGAAAMVTFVGHSTFLIQTPRGNVLTDPMFSDRAGPLNLMGPRRVRPPAVRLEDLPPIAAVALSHNHYDHCDLPTLRALAKRFDPVVVTPLGNGPLVRRTGLAKIEERDWWQTSEREWGIATITPAQHFSARGPFDRNRALWGGFMLDVGGFRIYFAGDTGYGTFFREIGRRLGPIDLALLPIGAYEPRWFMKDVHMNPAEAVRAHLDLEARHSVGMHFGTFQLTTEGIDEPVRALDEACRARGVSAPFTILGFGESLPLG